MSKGNKGNAKVEQVEEELEVIAELPAVVERRVNALKNIQKEHSDLEKKYRDEVAALEKKYQALYSPLYVKRATIVNGEYEPTDAEAKIEDEEAPKGAGDKDIKGIPDFWLTAMKHNSALEDLITKEDAGALAFLKDVKHTSIEGDKKGFALSFHFAENPYFTDSVLTKTYHLTEDEGMYAELVFERAEGTKIAWKAGKNLTVKLVKKAAKPARGSRGGKRGGGAKPAATQTVEEPCESFFHFFNPPQRPEAEEDEDDEEAQEEAEMIEEMLEADFEYGCVFKDKIIPMAVLWFTGEALDYEDDYGDDEFGGYDFDDEEGDDDDEDDDESEEDEPPKKGRGGPAPKKGGAAGGRGPAPSAKGGAPGQPQQPECKQQ